MAERGDKWAGRPWLARSVRALVFLGPILLSIASVVLAGQVVLRPNGLVPTIVWGLGLTALATLVLRLADLVFRKLLPIVALFKLSLVFPTRRRPASRRRSRRAPFDSSNGRWLMAPSTNTPHRRRPNNSSPWPRT